MFVSEMCCLCYTRKTFTYIAMLDRSVNFCFIMTTKRPAIDLGIIAKILYTCRVYFPRVIHISKSLFLLLQHTIFKPLDAHIDTHINVYLHSTVLQIYGYCI